MKSKRFLCTVLACVVMISCITNVAAIQEVPSRFMRKIVCRLRLSEVSRQ